MTHPVHKDCLGDQPKALRGTQDADARPKAQRNGDATQRTQTRIPSATKVKPLSTISKLDHFRAFGSNENQASRT